jgi:hypothetical protein
MSLIDALSISTTPEDAGGATEQEIFVDFQKFLLPEVFLVKDVCAEDLGGYTTSQVFKTFTGEASFDCSIVL